MGADSTLIFYGVRYPISEEETEALECKSDERIVRARENGLAHWWGTFSLDYTNEQEYLFVGALLGNIGHEGRYEIVLAESEFGSISETTNAKLMKAGFEEEPRLYIQFEPDF